MKRAGVASTRARAGLEHLAASAPSTLPMNGKIQGEDSMTRKREISLALVTCLCVVACVRKPVTAPRAVVPETVPSELRAAATSAKRFGHMLAIGVGISNGSAKEYLITADRVLAV
ncbi:MAG: hypothetical protein DMD82_10460, partial [Candidatus Rokuibacteriota bacterium]